MQRKHLTRILPLLILLIGLSSCISLAEDVTPPPGYQAPTAPKSTATSAAPVYPVLPPDPLRGALLYVEKCAACHGDTGLGDGPDAEMLSNPVAPLGDPNLARLAAPDDWYLMVSKGNMQNFMPPFASLSVPERWDVIAYAYTLSTTPEEVALGQEVYTQHCASCHGERGQGDGPEAGALATSPIDFTDQEFMGARSAADLFESITNGLGEMHSYADLAETDRWALTTFLRTLTFAELEPTSEGEITDTPDDERKPEATVPSEDAANETPSEELAQPEFGTVNIGVLSSSSAELPPNLEVILYSYEGMTQVYSNTLTLSEDGSTMVDDVPMTPEQFIFATMEYDGIVYGSDIAVVETGMNIVDLDIPYYEKTSDLSVVHADRLHIFFDFVTEDTVQVYALFIFSNGSDQVLAAKSSEDAVVVFALPEGAINLQRDTGMELQDIDLTNGFGLLTVYPSSEPYQVLYSFELPYEKNKADFELPIGLDTTAVIVMVPENGVDLKSDQLSDAGMRDIEGISYNIYNGTSLNTGDTLSMEVSGRPEIAPVSGDSSTGETSSGLVIGLAVFGITLIGMGLYLWQRNRSQDDDWDEVEGIPIDNPDDLMDAIIALDELHQTGEIPDDAYQKRRAELKERLGKLVNR